MEIFFGDSTFPVIMVTTTMVTSSPDNIIDLLSYIKMQGMHGILDSRRFDADKYFRLVSKYGKMPTNEVKWYAPANVSCSFMENIIGIIILRYI